MGIELHHIYKSTHTANLQVTNNEKYVKPTQPSVSYQ